jgi:hypothetical protein
VLGLGRAPMLRPSVHNIRLERLEPNFRMHRIQGLAHTIPYIR